MNVSVFSIILSVILCTVPVCYTIRTSLRIVGARPAQPGKSPYQVSIQYMSIWKHLCGGSIIDSKHVITAAHCVYKLSVLEIAVAAGVIRLSDPYPMRRSVDEIFIHKKFRPSLMNDNIAILRIHGRFHFETGTVEYITLPTSPVPTGTAVRAFGWGVSNVEPERYQDTLHEIEINTIDLSKCAFRYRNSTLKSLGVRKGMLCAEALTGPHSKCLGDGGGALVNPNRQLVGVASFQTNSCGVPNLPSIYADTYYYTHWIRDTIMSSSSLTFSRFSLTRQCLLLLYFWIHGT